MKKFFLICAVLTLAGCQAIGQLGGTKIPSQQDIYLLEAGYDAAFLVPLHEYAALPRCAAGQKLTVKALCYDKAILIKLAKVDDDIRVSLNNLKAFQILHPGDIGLSGLYNSASSAIQIAEDLASANSIR